ncbi:hypothetical protein Hanom_Chr14g01315371 [Helianthus anomalus]
MKPKSPTNNIEHTYIINISEFTYEPLKMNTKERWRALVLKLLRVMTRISFKTREKKNIYS